MTTVSPKTRDEEIRRLVAGGMTRKAVSLKLEVPLDSVYRVAKGIHSKPRPQKKQPAIQCYHLRRPKRCPTCGALVALWPCVGCAVEARKRKGCENSPR